MSSRSLQQVQPVLSLDPADHAAAAAVALKQQRQRNSRSRSRLEGEGELSDGSAFDEELDFGPEQECKYNDEGEETSTAAVAAAMSTALDAPLVS